MASNIRTTALRRLLGVPLAMLLQVTPAHAFRTVEDLPKLEGEDVVGWSQSEVEFRFDLDGRPQSLADDEVLEAAQAAIEAWSQTECLGFVPTVQSGQGEPRRFHLPR